MLTHLTQQLAADEQRKSMKTAATVEIENVGPIERLSIPLPQSGVVVLRGRNGCGKSHALAAVDQLASGRGKAPCRDGAAKGTIAGFGARLTIGRSTRRTGEAEVATLEGRLDISQLVQPPVKEEESADRIRIKALVQLSGAEADPKEFDRILPQGTTLGQLVAPNDYSDDPVVLAGRVKRALEAEARRAERIAAEARARAEAIASQCGEAPAEPCNLHEAEAELQKALLWQKELQTRAVEAAKAAEKARKAADAIESLKASAAAGDDPEALAAEEAELSESIAKLERALAVATERRAQVRRRLSEARTVAAQIEQLQRIVAASAVEPPGEIELASADAAVEGARARHAAAVEYARAARLRADADRARADAAEAEAEAARYRDAAAATDEVLSGLVAKVADLLRVVDGRLVYDTDRGAEPFGELSPGERWRIALEIAAEQVGRGGLVTVPQEAWEALDPLNRAEIAEIARSVGVVLLTAEAGDEPQVTPTVFAGDAEAETEPGKLFKTTPSAIEAGL